MIKHKNLLATLTAFAVVFSLFAFGSISSYAAPSQDSSERVIVVFEDGANLQHSTERAKSIGAHVSHALPIINGLALTLPQNAMSRLSSLPHIERVDSDVRVFATAPPGACSPWPECKNNDDDDGGGGSNQPAQILEWGVDQIDAELTWETSLGSGVDVAVIDTGIDKDHEDLMANIEGGINFVESGRGPAWKRTTDPDDWNDDNGHGTHVAGIIGALDNDIGVVGVAPQVGLYGVKVLDSSGSGYLSDVIAGIEWSVNNEMEVINMSLGTESDIQSLHDAVDAAYDAGLVVVASAGNSGDGDPSTNDVNYPAKYSSVIAIAATDINDDSPSWSSEGAEVEVAAPGVSIRSTWNDGLYNTISGTSMASPHAAGVAALIMADGVSTNSDVRSILQQTADDLDPSGIDNYTGYGLVDAEESVTGTESN